MRRSQSRVGASSIATIFGAHARVVTALIALVFVFAHALPAAGRTLSLAPGAALSLPARSDVQPWQITQAGSGYTFDVYRVRWPDAVTPTDGWWHRRLPKGWHVVRLGQWRWWLEPPTAQSVEGWLAQWQSSGSGRRTELWLSQLSRPPVSDDGVPPAVSADALQVVSDWEVETDGIVSRHRILRHATWPAGRLVFELASRWQRKGWRRLSSADSAGPHRWQRGQHQRHLIVVAQSTGTSALVLDEPLLSREAMHD